jgi:DNA-binding SARP family transcriptional activator
MKSYRDRHLEMQHRQHGAGGSEGAEGAPGAHVRLTLLGSWDLSIDGESVHVALNGQRMLALLALKGRLTRAYAAGMLWPDVFDEQASARLRSTLWRLQETSNDLVVREGQRLALAPHVEVDAAEASALARSFVDGDAAEDDVAEAALVMADTPELLLGWYDDWVVTERERLTQLHLHALEALADRLVARGSPAKALQVAMAAVQMDPLRESAHRAVIRAHLAAGNPVSAKRQYDRYRELMRAEFGVDQPTSQMLQTISALPLH